MTLKGFRDFARWLGGKEVVRVVFESTGAYHKAFEQALSAGGLPFSNPYRARQFAKVVGKLAKTDRVFALEPKIINYNHAANLPDKCTL